MTGLESHGRVDCHQVVSPLQSILDYELSLGIPPGWINYSISKTSPRGFWHRLERGEIAMDAKFFEGFSQDLHHGGRWKDFYRIQRQKKPTLPTRLPPVPRIDAEWLFHDMMRSSTDADPWMFPALRKLKASGHYILAACSNTVIFPDNHELASISNDVSGHPVRSLFDVFISSAHVGLRKPDPRIYRLVLSKVDEYARANADTTRGKVLGWAEGVKAGQVLFLDDIGENLRAARREGFATIKVHLGRTYEAVEELEKITGLALEGEHPKVPAKPMVRRGKAKI